MGIGGVKGWVEQGQRGPCRRVHRVQAGCWGVGNAHGQAERTLRQLNVEPGASERGLDTKEGRWTVATGLPSSPIYSHSQGKLSGARPGQIRPPPARQRVEGRPHLGDSTSHTNIGTSWSLQDRECGTLNNHLFINLFFH